jgi:hypothetical protein
MKAITYLYIGLAIGCFIGIFISGLLQAARKNKSETLGTMNLLPMTPALGEPKRETKALN